MAGSPLFAVSLAFVAGTALGAWLPQEPDAWGWAVLAALGFWSLLLAAKRVDAASRLGVAAFALLGIFMLQRDLAPLYAGGDRPEEGEAVASGRIARLVERRADETLLHIYPARLRSNGATVRLAQPLQIVVAGDLPGYAMGDLVTARGRVRAIRGDRNFGWFPEPVAPRGRRWAARLVVTSATWVRRDWHDPGRGPGAAVLRWRAAADASWTSRPGASAQILNALTTGERAGIPPEVQEAFMRSGLTHLLAISGMNVGFLAAAVFLVLRRALALCGPLSTRWPVQPVAAGLTLPSLWFFMLFSGSQIPVGRAVLCSGVGLVAVVLWRRARFADVWALAAAAIAAWDPRALFSASYQLSFAAVGALLLVASRAPAPSLHPEPGDCWSRRVFFGARALFVASVAVSALTAPLIAFHFQQVSLVGPLANLIAVPYTGLVVLPAGWLALAARALGEPFGEAVAQGALWTADRLVECAQWFARPSWSALSTARPPLLLTLCLLALAVALLPRPTSARLRAGLAACAAAAVSATWWALLANGPALRLIVLDVGQGLACVAVLPGGGSLLYDAGPRWRGYDAGERVVVPALRRLGITRLETLAISHAHPDHDGGVEAVLRAMPAGRVWRGTGPDRLERGDEFRLQSGVRVSVLNPPAHNTGRAATSAQQNDQSLALLLRHGATGFVLTADAGPAVAAGLAEATRPPPPQLALQVPHHGGSEEACRILGEALRPSVSVVPVGRNTYGHPRRGAIAVLEGYGRVLRTDHDGGVFVGSDGRALAVRTWREMAAGRTWAERVRWLVAGS